MTLWVTIRRLRMERKTMERMMKTIKMPRKLSRKAALRMKRSRQ